MPVDIQVRRIYDDPAPRDGTRVLVDRVWPRGVRKDAARLDDWAKGVAPSSELRKWYGHDPAKFGEFRRRYTAELAGPEPEAALSRLRALAAAGPLTLLTATRDVSHSQAAVLADLLQPRAEGSRAEGSRAEPGEGGEPVCWAHLVCPDCGAMESEGHRPGCAAGPPGPGLTPLPAAPGG